MNRLAPPRSDAVLWIPHTLVELERAVGHNNAGRKSAFIALIGEYLQHLASCGCHVRVERVS